MVVLNILNCGGSISEINDTFIALIPKRKMLALLRFFDVFRFATLYTK